MCSRPARGVQWVGRGWVRGCRRCHAHCEHQTLAKPRAPLVHGTIASTCSARAQPVDPPISGSTFASWRSSRGPSPSPAPPAPPSSSSMSRSSCARGAGGAATHAPLAVGRCGAVAGGQGGPSSWLAGCGRTLQEHATACRKNTAAPSTHLHVAYRRRGPAGERAGIGGLCRHLLRGASRPRHAHQGSQRLGGGSRHSRVGVIKGAAQQQGHVCGVQGMVPHRCPLQARRSRGAAALLLQRCRDRWRQRDGGGRDASHAGPAQRQHCSQQAQRQHPLLRHAAARQQARLLHAVPRGSVALLLSAAAGTWGAREGLRVDASQVQAERYWQGSSSSSCARQPACLRGSRWATSAGATSSLLPAGRRPTTRPPMSNRSRATRLACSAPLPGGPCCCSCCCCCCC